MKNTQSEREAYDLRKDEVEVLALLPYNKPGRMAGAREVNIAKRMVRGGFLEECPTSLRSLPVMRCTEKGADAVLWFKRRGWLPDVKINARTIKPPSTV